MADAEKVVLELEARKAAFTPVLNQAANETKAFTTAAEQSANKAEAAVARTAQSVVKSQGQIQAGQRNLGRQFADFGQSLSSGASPFVVIAQQLPQVNDALSDMGGRVGTVATALSGPFGAAAIAVGSVLATTLLPRLLQSGDGVDDLVKKMKEQARQAGLNAQATDIFSRSLEGLADAARKARQEAEQLNRTQLENLQVTYKQNENRVVDAIKNRADAQRDLNKAIAAQRSVEAQRSNVFSSDAAVQQEAQERAAAERVAAARRDLATAQQGVIDAQATVAQYRIPILDYQAAATDKATAATQRQEAAVRALRDAYEKATAAANALTDPTKRQQALDAAARAYRLGVEKANADLARAQKAIQEATAAANRKPDNAQVGRTVTVAEATSIIEGIGGRVTNGLRSRATQERLYADKLAGRHIGPVARPGTSDHETGNAIDVAYGPGISIASIKAAFKAQGVAIKQLLDEPTQRIYHVAFGDGGARRKADSDARAAEVDRVRAIRDNEAYESDKAQLNAEIVQAMRAQAVEAKDIAEFQRAEVNAATTRRVNAINADEAAGKYSAEQARNLRNLALQGDALQKLAIGVDLQRRQQDEANARIASNLRNQEDVLSAQLDIADTNAKRKAIELQLLDLKYRELRQQQEAIIGDTTGRYTQAQRDDAQARLNTLPDLQRADRIGVERRNEGPLASYLRTFGNDPQTQVEQAVVDKLQQVDQTITDAAASVLGVKDPFLKSLLQIFLQQNILKPLYDALQGAQGGGLGGLFSSVVGLFGGGKSLSSLLGQGNGVTSAMAVALPGLASGGTIRVMGNGGIDQNLLSINGQPVARVNRGEDISVNANARAVRGGNTVVQQTFVLDARQGIVTPQLLQYVNETARQEATRAGVASYRQSMRDAPGRLAKYQRFGS